MLIPPSFSPPAINPEHGGIEGPVWLAWNLDPTVVVPAIAVGWWYARGVKRWRGRSRTHPWWRTALFYTGLATILLAIESPIDRLGEHHFAFHVVQHEMFVMLGAPLMLLGAPTTPLLRGAPRWIRREMVPSLSQNRTFRSATHVLTHPVVGLVFLLGLLWAWHLAPGWYDAALRNDLIHDLQHGSFIAAGFLFWWPVIDPAPLYSPMNYPLRVPYLFVAALGKIVLATVLAFSSEPLYSGYANVNSHRWPNPDAGSGDGRIRHAHPEHDDVRLRRGRTHWADARQART